MRKPKTQKKPLNDLSRSLTPFDPNQTLIGIQGCGTNVRAPHAGSPPIVIPTTASVPACSAPVKDEPCGGANAPSLTAPARAAPYR